MKLVDAEQPIREALTRLAESPRVLRCFTIIEDVLTKRFVQFCTPPPPSIFAGSSRITGPEPLIFDGAGNGKPGGYDTVQELCDIDTGVRLAMATLAAYLPPDAELRIIEESTRKARPS